MRRVRSTHGIAALITGAMLPMVAGISHAVAQAQGEAVAAQRFTFNVAAQPVPQGLNAIGRVAGFSVVVNGALPSSIRGKAVSGSLTAQQAFAAFLAGTGLTYSFTNANTVTVSTSGVGGNDAAATLPGAIALDTIDVGGTAEGGSDYSPYETPAPTAHISAENIERFRGSSPADIFRGTPGVMSGEARNGAGSIDVNIRGMQGMGRVATTIDGAENSLQIYQGYQGLSSRTFVDPDLIAGVDITKGSDASSRGIAGTVAMRTVDAGDIVKPGQKWGVRIKGEAGTNTSTPEAGNRAGYQISNPIGSTNDPSSGYGTAVPSEHGMDRPGLLTPTQGSASVVTAFKDDNIDLLAAYAYRERGNYHAGKHGPSANPVSTGPRPFCYSSGYCPSYLLHRDYVENQGLSNYRAGEEVLNTELQTESWLTKATLRFGDGHSLKFGYTGFRSEAGDRLASALTSDASQPVQQTQTAGTVLDTGTLRYLWKPAGNDLIDLKANFWVTDLELRNPPRNAYGTKPESLGLSKYFRTGSDTVMWGGDTTNTSRVSFEQYGALEFTYGLSYVNEDTRPSAYTDVIEGWLNLRDAAREEAGAFTKVAYKPTDWLTLNGGLRYSHFWSNDRSTSDNSAYVNPDPKRDEGGFSPSAGITLEPTKGTQFYVNYSNALRYPSLFESASAFTIIPNPDLSPERASNWEIGANFQRDGILVADDKAMIKLGYFNWDVSDYIAREFRPFEGPGYTWWGMQVYNIDRAKFSGLEFSGRYEQGGFTADLAANYYLSIEYCRTSDTCAESSLYGDYATNHVPPKYTVDLTLSQKLFDDALTVGGRVSYVGPRAIEHGLVTAQGLSSFISQINWESYTLVDLFLDYKINDTWTLGARVENVTDQFYVDPLGLVNQPGPGRTFYASITTTLGGE
ncbi:TonB-dependent receptor domain-containing protein [Hyphomicrobium sp. LHD-15]|uniref:TonB-dependent receptor domain-containing protein n=1 Tax=Hyphomicrobium sp. LHD-15 TaxID=3072142 RepID=UPI00280F451D|nr:TonB-dependent receptor [Hyphomicrobium sp. LHD-15]MDQ8697366.1 TonB-dependent receptor [Hyphomicrobium sp. LHD-15]